MEKDETKKLVNQLNLKADCFTGEINPIVRVENKNGTPYIKLYHKICFACKEEGNPSLYPLDRIIRLNTNKILNYHNCKDKCGIEGCVVSLKVKEYDNENSNPDYRYSKIDKIDIIYK